MLIESMEVSIEAWDAMLWSNGPKELTSSVSLVHRPIACAITIPPHLDLIKAIG